jgi:hypothetical protein
MYTALSKSKKVYQIPARIGTTVIILLVAKAINPSIRTSEDILFGRNQNAALQKARTKLPSISFKQ